jgi:gluconate 2-dehydrogenase gamma chain
MWILKQPDSEFLTDEEKAQVAALFDGILPPGETSPGASDAGAAEYLSRLLAMDASEHYEIPKWQQLYRSALPVLENAAKSGYGGKGLAALSAEERRDFLTKLSQGTLAGADGIDQRTLFATLRGHCIEGCFADPRWGGNRDGAMWRWYGYLQKPQAFRRTAS